ncbi:hypothetical protein PV326_003505 [Microctonus aethiopoides]|nr:hypothetical protein PV326_003505 [Microctonus aethiopoides]
MNLIILILYRTGYGGEFLGVGGTWNLNEDKNPDAEIVASGVFVGFFIYTSVVLLTYCFGTTKHKKTLVEIIMNFVGMFMFIAVGGTALHYWHGYQSEHKYLHVDNERQIGLAVGSLCVLEGATYLVDTLLSFYAFAEDGYDFYFTVFGIPTNVAGAFGGFIQELCIEPPDADNGPNQIYLSSLLLIISILMITQVALTMYITRKKRQQNAENISSTQHS